jgi:hypothetical protein
MSGTPVVLELRPTAPVSTDGFEPVAKPNSKSIAYYIAADVQCRLIFEGNELTSSEMPVFQLGRKIYTAKPVQTTQKP